MTNLEGDGNVVGVTITFSDTQPTTVSTPSGGGA